MSPAGTAFNAKSPAYPAKAAIRQFHSNAKEGNLAGVKAFLDTYNNQAIDEKDGFCSTALMLAAKEGQAGIVHLLLEHGASPHAKDDSGRTPLYYSIQEENDVIVSLLLDHGADVDLQDSDCSYTALMSAVYGGYESVIRLLLDRGASLDKTDKWGGTPLMIAEDCLSRHERVIKMLMEEPERRRVAAAAKKERRREAMRVFTEGLKKNFRSPKSPFKPLRRKP